MSNLCAGKGKSSRNMYQWYRKLESFVQNKKKKRFAHRDRVHYHIHVEEGSNAQSDLPFAIDLADLDENNINLVFAIFR